MSRHALGDGFALALLGVLTDDAARAAVRRVLREWAGCRVYLPAHRADERRRHALSLVEIEHDPRRAAERLMQRTGCTYRTARRHIAEARQSSTGQGPATTAPTIAS